MFCLAVHISGTAAASQEVQQSLKQQYEGKILILRHPLQGGSLKYDSDGKVLKGGGEGSWTIYGRIKIVELHLQADKLLLKGVRVDYKLDGRAKQLVPSPNRKHVSVQISLNGTLQNITDADAVLGHIFAFTKKDVVDSAPELWRSYLNRTTPSSDGQTAAKPDQDGGLLTDEAKAGKEKFWKNTTPPKPVYTPEPSFPDSMVGVGHFEGVVVLSVFVDETGRVGQIRIVRPLGEGLDEEAVNTVKKWVFRPAQHEGRAVGVEMNIECAFNLSR
jgi:TonB family protein